ncbi:hypothetical protein FRC01_000335 [Tulasnella sp. 417]|nr:hypothetical protein FRC01_000335 [Tulasnella sp. 417]
MWESRAPARRGPAEQEIRSYWRANAPALEIVMSPVRSDLIGLVVLGRKSAGQQSGYLLVAEPLLAIGSRPLPTLSRALLVAPEPPTGQAFSRYPNIYSSTNFLEAGHFYGVPRFFPKSSDTQGS